jgi:N-acyl-D-amino-acid deacylase
MKPRKLFAASLVLVSTAACGDPSGRAEILFLGASVLDGTGEPAAVRDVAVTGDRIAFVGNASVSRVQATDTIDVSGLLLTPGFIDMHSHAELDAAYGRDGRAFLHQGVTTVVLGVDGGGGSDVADRMSSWSSSGIGVNAVLFVGHNAARRAVMGMEDRAPTADELERMKAFVRKGMEEGAQGLSSGLFYLPGNYADTEEVIELNRVAAEYPEAIYDTHDRDLGAAYPSFGYLRSIEEGIRIGEAAGTKVIFSHFNAQGALNYGRAPEGAAVIEAARSRGVDVQAAQHVYTATQSNLRSYTIPGWAVAGGDTAMVRRFDHADTVDFIDRQSRDMLKIRGGADRLLFADPRPNLNGRTLAEVAQEWGLEPTAAARRILRDGNASVMNLGLYDPVNTRYLAGKEWMMTCTDGRDPGPDQAVTHPRVFGAFTKKLKDMVIDEEVISMPFAVRSMTGLAADFLGWQERGYIREGMVADIAVLDEGRIQDRATFEQPKAFAEGTVHVLVNGSFAVRDGAFTGTSAGRPILRNGNVFELQR